MSHDDGAHAALAAAHRAFLHKDYVASLLASEQSLAAAHGDTDLLARTIILRYTVALAVFTNAPIRERVCAALAAAPDGAHAAALLTQPAGGLVAALWAESLRVFAGRAPEPPSLEPTPETARAALALPTAVISSAVLMALRADMATGDSRFARQLCEWYFGALIAPDAPQPDPTQYTRVLRLYTVHVLGIHMHDWDYARSFAGYSRLADSEKHALIADIDAAQGRVETRATREQAAAEHAQQQYRAQREGAQEAQGAQGAEAQGVEAQGAEAQGAEAQGAEAQRAEAAPKPTPAPTPAPKPAPAPTPAAPSAPPSGTSLRRTTSIRRRPDALRAHDYLARRPHDDLAAGDKRDAPAPEATPLQAGYAALRAALQSSAVRVGACVLVLVATYRVANRARAGAWLMVFVRRFWDTLRMYVPILDKGSG